MTIVKQIRANLLDTDAHGPYLDAIVSQLETGGERAVKALIKNWIQQIEDEQPPHNESETTDVPLSS